MEQGPCCATVAMKIETMERVLCGSLETTMCTIGFLCDEHRAAESRSVSSYHRVHDRYRIEDIEAEIELRQLHDDVFCQGRPDSGHANWERFLADCRDFYYGDRISFFEWVVCLYIRRTLFVINGAQFNEKIEKSQEVPAWMDLAHDVPKKDLPVPPVYLNLGAEYASALKLCKIGRLLSYLRLQPFDTTKVPILADPNMSIIKYLDPASSGVAKPAVTEADIRNIRDALKAIDNVAQQIFSFDEDRADWHYWSVIIGATKDKFESSEFTRDTHITTNDTCQSDTDEPESTVRRGKRFSRRRFTVTPRITGFF